MGAGQSTEEKKEGATAPTMPEEKEGADVGLPMVGGRRRKSRKSRSRKTRKGKRHGRK